MICDIDGQKRNLPDFLIVGAAKSGTTSLHEYLSLHPDVAMPKYKETMFFHIVTNPNRSQSAYTGTPLIDTFEDYLAQFDSADQNQICGESCPSYLYFHEHTIGNIKRFHPRWQDLKIVIILREPVDKIVSHYFFVKNTLSSRNPVLSAETIEQSLAAEPARLGDPSVLPDLLYIDNTCYVRQVKAYLDDFAHVNVFLFDDLRDRPQKLFADLCEFLGIRADVDCGVGRRYHVGARHVAPRGVWGRFVGRLAATSVTKPIRKLMPRKIKDRIWAKAFVREDVSQATRRRLKDKFRDQVKELENMLNLDLSCWGY